MPDLPPCKNPHHPPEYNRSSGMIVLEESAERVVFACVPCRDICKQFSVQVRTLPMGWQKAKYGNDLVGVKRASEVIRGREGRIRYFDAK